MAEHDLGRASALLPEGGMQPLELEGEPALVAGVDGQYCGQRQMRALRRAAT